MANDELNQRQPITGARPYHRYWAKTLGPADALSWHLLTYHSLDVAAVGTLLPSVYPRLFAELALKLELTTDSLRALLARLLLLHDAGKFATAFQCLNAPLFRHQFGPDKKPKPYGQRHDTLGFVLWRDALHTQVQSISPELAATLDRFARPAFGHHGLPPQEHAHGGTRPLRLNTFFDEDDVAAAIALVLDGFAILPQLGQLPPIRREQNKAYRHASWRVAGLCTLADWLGSNQDYFRFCQEPRALADYWNDIALPSAEQGLAAADLSPARSRPFGGIAALFPFVQRPTALQEHAATIELPAGPTLWIIEDLTGAGKTEAALTLAHRLIAAGRADGMYVALPTMATANAMYARVGDAYRHMYDERTLPSLVLAHSARHLSDAFRHSAGVQPQPHYESDSAEITAGAYCNRWLADSGKKALLAEVGVGTIDQALLGVLQVRHQSLRLLGLQRKILILDEVHAYDAYTGRLLQQLVEEHARGGGSAILLSATLPAGTKRDLVNAFGRGIEGETDSGVGTTSDRFPLVTSVSRVGTSSFQFAKEPERTRHTTVSFVHEYEVCLQTIERAAKSGKCVCWVRNTVGDAKQALRDLVELGVASETVTLFHSRFAMIDRARIEDDVIATFGKESGSAQRAGRVLVATQVVEQSLDLDFDIMVSDLAPIDLLIQRAGRLMRHRRTTTGDRTDGQDQRGTPMLTVFAPPFEQQPTKEWPPLPFKGTGAVYRHIEVLWLTQSLLRERGGWMLPDDARALVEYVYGNDADERVPDGLAEKQDRASGEDHARRGQADLNVIDSNSGYTQSFAQLWDEEQDVPTRLGALSVEVALAAVEGDALVPYARAARFGWDQSIVRVAEHAWQQHGYQLPTEHSDQAEEIQNNNPRLKYAHLVVVPSRSDAIDHAAWRSCADYDPHFGWQGITAQEDR